MDDLDNKVQLAKERCPPDPDLSEDVQLLAARALALLAETKLGQPKRLAERIHWLADQFRSDDPQDAKAAIDDVLGDGVTIDDVIDHVLPAIARILGDRWFADDISFVDVTIGTARLQETVRVLRSRECPLPVADGRDARVLLILPSPEEHSLGAFVAADQLRRRGLMVELSVAEKRQELAKRLRARQHKMIGISASGVRTIASVKELVETIRQNTTRFTPIALGGPLAESEDALQGRVPVDVVSTDICAAARQCGLLLPATDTE